MKKLRFFLLVSILSVFFLSCRKGEKELDSTDIIGDYDFVGMDANKSGSSTVLKPLDTTKTVTTTHFSSFENIGTVKFTSSNIMSSVLYDSINSIYHDQFFVNSKLISEVDSPYKGYCVTTGGTVDYVRNTKDSLTFANAIFHGLYPFSDFPKVLIGARISWKGDTLLLKINQEHSATFLQPPNSQKVEGVQFMQAVIKLKKK